MIRPPRLNRAIERYLSDPESVRTAIWLLIAVMVFAVLVGSLVMWTFDHDEYPTFGRALWFTAQTATTVGYGDVTPRSTFGRIVGGVVMVVAIAFITVITAALTSAFVQAARRRMNADPGPNQFTEITERLDRIEETLRQLAESRGDSATLADRHET